MEEEDIEAVLSKTIDLRLRINDCIHNATTIIINNSSSPFFEENKQEGVVVRDQRDSLNSQEELLREADEEVEEWEETKRLLRIRDALDSLEQQLSSLQALQLQQREERETALVEIELSHKMLLDKLKEYKGKNMDVIQEASAFTIETVECNTNLLLPHPCRPPTSLVVQNNNLSHFPAMHKSTQNGATTSEAKKKLNESEPPSISKNSSKRLGHAIIGVAKAVISIVGVISVLNLCGLGSRIGKGSIPFNILGKRQKCPPGKVLVIEDGEDRCIVKERVAIPFESVVAKPDVNYGCG